MRQKILRNTLIVAIFMAGLFSVSMLWASGMDRVLVVVNDEVITQREFDRVYEPFKQSVLQSGLEGEELARELENAKEEILEQLVDAKLVISLAKQREVEVDQEEVDSRIETIRSYYSSEEEFLRELAQKGTNLTGFREELSEQLLAQELVHQEVLSRIDITPGELRDAYEKNKDVLLAPETVNVKVLTLRRRGEEGERRGLIDTLHASLQENPEKFDDLINEYSDGPYASEGGKMGDVVPGQTLPEINDSIFSLDKGEMSGVVSSDIGYHIFKVLEREESRQLSFSEVRDYLREQLYMSKFQEKLEEWIEKERRNAYISYR